MPEDKLYIEKARRHQARYQKLIRFTSSSTKAAAVMLLAAVASIIIANTNLYPAFLEVLATPVGFVVGTTTVDMTVARVIKEILMALFFLMVGLEIKHEMTVGELTNVRQAILPIIAACGGVLVPILIYLAFNMNSPETIKGWAIPSAVDIAFVLGLIALLGSRVPNGVRVFVGTLAVTDDIIPIVIIAVFYGKAPDLLWTLITLAVVLVLVIFNRAHVYSLVPYLLIGIVLWYCILMSGIHTAVAGIILAFIIPTGSRINMKNFISWSSEKVKTAEEFFEPDAPVAEQKNYMKTVTALSRVAKQVVPPATRLEKRLYPWVSFLILPLFALAYADVRLVDLSLIDTLANPAFLGVFFGLVVGKPVGILLFSFIMVKLKISKLPAHANWGHMIGAGLLCGVGFTMAIFITNLAFTEASIVAAAKLGIFCASAVAGIAGFMFLYLQASAAKRKGITYVSAGNIEMVRQTADSELLVASQDILDSIDDPELRKEIEAAKESGSVVEFAVTFAEDSSITYHASCWDNDECVLVEKKE